MIHFSQKTLKVFYFHMRFDRKRQKSFFQFFLPVALILFFLFSFLNWFVFIANEVKIEDFEQPPYDRDIFESGCTNSLLRDFYTQFGRKNEQAEQVQLISRSYKPGFCIIDNLWEPSPEYWQGRRSEDIPIGMALHATPDMFHHLEEQLQTWDGLFSLTLVIPFNEDLEQREDHNFAIQHILETLERLKTTKRLDQRVWLHLLFETSQDKCPRVNYFRPKGGFIDDSDFAELMLSDMKRLCASKRPYPINVARNLARLGLQTPLFLSTDIENLFSYGYAHKVQKLANQILLKEGKRTVLVHRRFESEKDELLPRSIKALNFLLERRKAFVFHELVFPAGHSIPFLDEWLQWEGTDGKRDLEIQKEFNYFGSEFEPQFVARNDETVPLHDESFPFRIRPNVELAHELCHANFTFSLMHGVFSVHRGVKRRELAKYSKLVDETTRKELPKIVQQFRRKLDILYKQNGATCPVFAPEIPINI